MPLSEPVVETCSGRIAGLRLDQCMAFLGIPYARAERFEAPRPASPWAGVLSAQAFGPMAPQSDPQGSHFGIIFEHLPQPVGAAPPPNPVESEECQVINVWTADLAPERPRPVMVWLHPGFFMLGAGTSGNGAQLAARADVVVVSLNHRLNLLGYCHLDDVADGFQHSGNAGQLDIVGALKWVQRNIHRFGGDASRVTVFGASGGGMKTAWLMASPKGRGLLHRAGAQSGPCMEFMERGAASAMTQQLLDTLGLKTHQADDLRRIPVKRLLAAYHQLRLANPASRFTQLAGFAPVIDPDLLPHHPSSAEAAEAGSHIPMFTGWNREDMAFFPGRSLDIFALDNAGLRQKVEELAGDLADKLISAYSSADPKASASRLFLRIWSDWSIGGAVLAQADRRAGKGKAPTYVYRFDQPSAAMGGVLGAVHSSETSYVFAQPGPFAAPQNIGGSLGAAIRNAWVHFASCGSMDAPGNDLPGWQPYNEEGRVMTLGPASRAISAPIPEYENWAVPC